MFPIRDSIPSRTVPIATRALILVNVIVFLFELTVPGEVLERAVYIFGVVPARLTDPEWAASIGLLRGGYWSILTHQFLHGGWLHIISNMWTLWIFGDNVEDRMGPVRFIVFYLLCGAIAGLTHVFTNAASIVPTLGASGAIAGVLGAYFLLFPTARVVVLFPIFIFPLFFQVPAVLYLAIWFLTQLFSGTMAVAGPQAVAGIAWWAHIGGFLGGMLLCWVFVRRMPAQYEDEVAGREL